MRTWARDEGIEAGSVFQDVDPELVDRYLAHLGLAGTSRTVVDLDNGDHRVSAETCPQCGNAGYLEHIDLKSHTQTQRCRPCGHWWETQLVELGTISA